MLGEIIGEAVTETACPFGSYDRRVLRATRAAGYQRVFTSDGGPIRLGTGVAARTSIGTSKPLEYWTALAAGAGTSGPSAALKAKRLLKRLR